MISINIIYLPQESAAHKVYENSNGEVWRSSTYDENKINIGMSWYSLRDPKPNDNLWVIEPRCVSEIDYDPNFVCRFNKIFTWSKAFENTEFKDKVVKLNHPNFHYWDTNIHNKWIPWEKRRNEIVFIANNKHSKHDSELYSMRIELAELLSQTKYKVSWFGQIPINKPYYVSKAGDKFDLLNRAKFSVCIENCYDGLYSHNYLSEKMPEVWQAGCIPLYMGCHNIDDYFTSGYIDLRKFIIKDNNKFIIAHKEQLVNYINNFNESKKIQNEIKDIVSKDQMHIFGFNPTYEAMINAFK